MPVSESNDSFTSAAMSLNQENQEVVVRKWQDVFWFLIFAIHFVLMAPCLGVLGRDGVFDLPDKVDYLLLLSSTSRSTEKLLKFGEGYHFWMLYAAGGGGIGLVWLVSLRFFVDYMMKVSVHLLIVYLAVIGVSCFWSDRLFWWGVAFVVWACLQFIYIMSVSDRLPYTMLVLRKSVKLVLNLPEAMKAAYLFIVFLLMWIAIWSFGVAGVVAKSKGDLGGYICLFGLSVSLAWVGAVLRNTLQVVVSRIVFLVLYHGGRRAEGMPPKVLVESLYYAFTTSLGSSCYGSLFTSAIQLLRVVAKGIRTRVETNECLLYIFDLFIYLVELLMRFCNKYACVYLGMSGKNFNMASRDAWEDFQSTGFETLVSYDCVGGVIWMCTVLGGLITGTCAAVWAWITIYDRAAIVGFTTMLIGMVLTGLAMVVVDSAACSIYVCCARDVSLIQRWDAVFVNRMSEVLQRRIQYRSNRASEV